MSISAALLKKIGIKGAAAGFAGEVALNAAFTYPTYKQDRSEGHGFGYSLTHSVASTIIMNEFLLPTMALSLAPMVPVLHQLHTAQVANLQNSMMPMSDRHPVIDSQMAQTSRQRSLTAIAQSRMSARSALGNEAGLYAPRFR